MYWIARKTPTTESPENGPLQPLELPADSAGCSRFSVFEAVTQVGVGLADAANFE